MRGVNQRAAVRKALGPQRVLIEPVSGDEGKRGVKGGGREGGGGLRGGRGGEVPVFFVLCRRRTAQARSPVSENDQGCVTGGDCSVGMRRREQGRASGRAVWSPATQR